MWQYSSSLMCFLNGRLLGDEKDLTSWAKNQWSFTFTRPLDFYMALAEDYYTKHLQKTGASQHKHSHLILNKGKNVLCAQTFYFLSVVGILEDITCNLI